MADNLIFLDVDGVLNNQTWAIKMYEDEGVRVYNEDLLEDRALLLLTKLVDLTGAKIVVSSAWRKISRSFQALKDQLGYYGMDVFDVTPYVGSVRGDDITAWFNRNPGEYRYVILDDDSDMDGHMDHLVMTDFCTGLTDEIVTKCVKMLTAKE